jgi:hypothetical protein
MKIWKIAMLSAPLIVAACSDVGTVPTLSSGVATTEIASPDGSAQRSVSVGSQNPPADVPPEYQNYTSVSVSADAGFIGQTAYGQALVSYSGNNGSATVDLVARNAQGTTVGSNSGTVADSHVFPSNYSMTANTTILLSASCGITINATASGKVWDTFLSANQSMLTWGNKAGSDTKGAAQPACPTTPPPNTCPAKSRLGPSFDCTSPSGGDGSTPPPSESTPPPLYVPPYYSPKPGQWNCIPIYVGTDHEQLYCWWVENNDTRIANGSGALRSISGTHVGQPSFTTGDKLPSVFVIVSDKVPAGTMAVVERHKQGPYKNVLLVPSASFRPAELVRAMRFLYASLAADGETPLKEFSAELKGTVADADVSIVERDYAATFTTMLSKAKSGNVGVYGARPFLEIQLGEAKTK